MLRASLASFWAAAAVALALVATCPLRGVEGTDPANKIEIYDRYTLHECTDPNGTHVLNEPDVIAFQNRYFNEIEIESILVVSTLAAWHHRWQAESPPHLARSALSNPTPIPHTPQHTRPPTKTRTRTHTHPHAPTLSFLSFVPLSHAHSRMMRLYVGVLCVCVCVCVCARARVRACVRGGWWHTAGE
jgi:hypothetical protein